MRLKFDKTASDSISKGVVLEGWSLVPVSKVTSNKTEPFFLFKSFPERT